MEENELVQRVVEKLQGPPKPLTVGFSDLEGQRVNFERIGAGECQLVEDRPNRLSARRATVSPDEVAQNEFDKIARGEVRVR